MALAAAAVDSGARLSLPGLARAASASGLGAVGGRAAGGGERPLLDRRGRAGLCPRQFVRLSVGLWTYSLKRHLRGPLVLETRPIAAVRL